MAATVDPILPGPGGAAPATTLAPAPPGPSTPLPLRLRHSLAARITALVALVLVATALASVLYVPGFDWFIGFSPGAAGAPRPAQLHVRSMYVHADATRLPD